MSDSKKAGLAAAKRIEAEARARDASGGGTSVTSAGHSNTVAGIPLIPVVAIVAVLGVVAIAFLTRRK